LKLVSLIAQIRVLMRCIPLASLLLLILSGWARSLMAVEIIKADNVDPLQNASSWSGGVAPTSADIAVWNSSLVNQFTSTLSTASSWSGIKVTDITNALTINLTAGLALGSGGIDLSTATQDVAIRSANNQTISWTPNPLAIDVADERTLTLDVKLPVATFHKNGEGTLILEGSSDNGGTVGVINAGTLILAKNSSSSWHALGGGTHIINGGTLQLAGTGDDQIYTTATVSINNSGILDFNGRNEGWGRLDGSASSLITNTAAVASVMTIGENNSSGGTFAGSIANGTGGLSVIKTGTGTQSFSGTANTYTGGTTINGGILQIAEDGSLGASSGQITFNSGGVLMNHSTTLGTITTARQINLAGDGGLRAGYSKNIVVTGLVTGDGSLRIHNDSGYVVVSNTGNNYVGNTIIGGTGNGNAARLLLGDHEVLPNGTAVVFDAGGTLGSTTNTATLNLNGKTETIFSLSTLSGFGSIISTNGSDSTTVNNAKLVVNGNATSTYIGSMSNNIHLEHAGSGELTLAGTGDNSAMRLTVSGGTVVLAKTSTASHHAVGGATHTINNGATLKLAGTGNDQIYFGSTIQINAGGTWDFGGVEFEDVNHISGNGLITNNTAATTSKLVLGSNLDTATSVHHFAGQINDGSGIMALEKNGTHTLVLTGNSNFSGGAVVNAGTLGGTGTVGTGSLTIREGAKLSPGATTSDATSLGAGTLTVNGSLHLESGSSFIANLALGGVAGQTDRVKLIGAIALEGAQLDLVWGGTTSNVYNGTFGANNMFWITEGATSLTGTFENFGAASVGGLFGSVEYAQANINGQEFALFYHSQYGVYNQTGLSGGNDLLLVAIPEPARGLLLLMAAGCCVWFRRR
jgi:fibronectin-binding autotransporter adhesin